MEKVIGSPRMGMFLKKVRPCRNATGKAEREQEGTCTKNCWGRDNLNSQLSTSQVQLGLGTHDSLILFMSRTRENLEGGGGVEQSIVRVKYLLLLCHFVMICMCSWRSTEHPSSPWLCMMVLCSGRFLLGAIFCGQTCFHVIKTTTKSAATPVVKVYSDTVSACRATFHSVINARNTSWLFYKLALTSNGRNEPDLH